MTLRKRGYKRDSDTWLGTALHNARVDAQNAKKQKAQSQKRRNAVAAKLNGEGIHESWADDAIKVMDKYGYSLNQVSTRVVPHIKDAMKAQRLENERKAAVAAEKAAARAQRENEIAEKKRLKQLASQERAAAAAAAKLAAQKNRESELAERERLRLAVLHEKQEATRLALQQLASDKEAAVSAARLALEEVHLEMREELSSLGAAFSEHFSTLPQKLRETSATMKYFSLRRRGAIYSIIVLAAELASIFVSGAIVSYIVSISIADALGTVLLIAMMFALPLYGFWRFSRLRGPELKLSVPSVRRRLGSLIDAHLLKVCERFLSDPACRLVAQYSEKAVPAEVRTEMERARAMLHTIYQLRGSAPRVKDEKLAQPEATAPNRQAVTVHDAESVRE